MSLKPGQRRNVLSMANRLAEIKEETKVLYDEMDMLTERICGLVGVGEEVDYPKLQKIVRVVDNFADKNVVFRPAAVRRVEIQVEDY